LLRKYVDSADGLLSNTVNRANGMPSNNIDSAGGFLLSKVSRQTENVGSVSECYKNKHKFIMKVSIYRLEAGNTVFM
jgi:predicted RNase H-related nuclease YkuK (DUF458 family)